MAIPRSVHRWLRLPGRVALILGLGALFTPTAQADAPEQGNKAALDDVLIRSEGGKIYLSEGGRKFQELELKDTPEARYLKQLLKDHGQAAGSAGIRLRPTILAGGGGSNVYWWAPAKNTDSSDKTSSPNRPGTADKPTAPGKAGAPRDTGATGDGKKG